jgi:hypothetical protein
LRRTPRAQRLRAEMGQGQSGAGGGGEKPEKKPEKKRYEPPPPPTRVGKKQRKRGAETASRLPTVTPTSKCKLRLLKLERVKDYLLMEEEFVTNQERLKPQEARNEEERTKVDDLRGSPMSVGNLEEIIDDRCVAEAGRRLWRVLRGAPCSVRGVAPAVERYGVFARLPRGRRAPAQGLHARDARWR